MQKTALVICLFATMLAVGCRPRQTLLNQITVAAAADLAPAFEELGRNFEQQHSVKVIFSFGSSGMLEKQIENGAPMDLFASANTEYIDELDRKGLIVPGTKTVYARGRITLWTLKTSPLKIEKIQDLARPEVKRIAIANPEHAPYGTVAREALEKAGIWETVQPRVIFGENVRQTLQYAQTGNVDVAIVALSLSLQSDGRWVLVPQELHRPLDQALGVIKGSMHEQTAREFAAFINSPQGREIMRKYGLTLPGENPYTN
jgi:molybdate transport system substrate-binding protein